MSDRHRKRRRPHRRAPLVLALLAIIALIALFATRRIPAQQPTASPESEPIALTGEP